MNDIKQFRAGDIVKYKDGPAEVFVTYPKDGLLFIMEKRNLRGHFVTPDKVEFVRRPDASEIHWSYRRKK